MLNIYVPNHKSEMYTARKHYGLTE